MYRLLRGLIEDGLWFSYVVREQHEDVYTEREWLDIASAAPETCTITFTPPTPWPDGNIVGFRFWLKNGVLLGGDDYCSPHDSVSTPTISIS